MKKLVFIIFLFPLFAFAQNTPLKKADVIIVSNSTTPEDNFKLVKQTLADDNIEIASQDKETGQIKSGLITIKKTGSSAYFIFNCKQDKIRITGYYKSGIELTMSGVTSVDSFTPICNKGMNGSMNKESFNAMNNFAKKIGPDVSYDIMLK